MYKIIFADDEAVIRNSIEEIIEWEKYGFRLVSCVSNGHELIEAVEKNNPDLVISDISMPFVNGIAAAKEIRRIQPKVKLVFLTGYNEVDYMHQAIDLKVFKYLLKPITANNLVKVLQEVKKSLDDEFNKKKELLKLKDFYQNHSNSMKEFFLNTIIEHPEDRKMIENKADELSLELLKNRNYVLALVRLEKYNGQNKNIPNQMLVFALFNIVSELLNDEKIGYATLNEKTVTILFCLLPENKSYYEQVEIILETVRYTIKSLLKLQTFIGVGDYVDDTKKIYDSFQGATVALDFAERTKENIIVNIKDIRKKDNFININSNPYIKVLGNINVDTEEELCRVLESVNDRKDFYDTRLLKVFIIDALIDLIKKAEMFEQDTRVYYEKFAFSEISRMNEKAEIINHYRKCIIYYIQNTKKQNRNTRTEICNLAISYIEEHYQEDDLSIQKICNNIHISESYFRSIFKQEKGMTIGNYLTEVRMLKAKKLIHETDLKNYEISELVGYSDPHYFSYCFKKFFGMSPKNYRLQNK